MTELRADAPAFTPTIIDTRTTESLKAAGRPVEKQRGKKNNQQSQQSSRHQFGDAVSTSIDANASKHGNKKMSKRCKRRWRSKSVRESLDWVRDQDAAGANHDTHQQHEFTLTVSHAESVNATLQDEEPFPILGTRKCKRDPLLHEVWTLTDRIQTNVASEWKSPCTIDDQAAAADNDTSHTSMRDFAKRHGLILLSSCDDATLHDDNGVDKGGSVSNDERDHDAEHPILYSRRRMNVSKLRDKMFDSLSERLHNQRALDAAAEEKTVKEEAKVAALSEAAETVDESYAWEYVQTTAPTALESLPPLDQSYLDAANPLHEAIENNDEKAVSLLLRRDEDLVHATTSPSCSPIQSAVTRNRPNILRLLLKNQTVSSLPADPKYPPAPHMAVKRGHEDCLQLLLSHSTNIVLIKDEKSGNNLLHACCSKSVPFSTLQLVIYVTSNSSSTLLSKAMMSVNDRSETPLHTACRLGLCAHVDVFLSNLGFTLLSKLFQMKDSDEQTPFLAAVASGSTDVVMSLFMWRGNNHVKISSKSIPCPLSWAVKTRNVDMVMLLLEFNDPCGRGYDLARALRVALEGCDVVMDHDDYDTLELCRVLVQAGANPCDSSGESGLVMAVKKRDSRTLATLIDSYDCRLQEMRTERCKDPVLQKQPASFFAGMDSRESAERSSSLREALVTALFDFHVAATESASKSFLCAQVLFQRGAELGTSGLSRLKRSITLRSLQDNTFSSDFIDRQFIYRVAHLDIETIGVNANNEMHWSMVMLHMPWMTSADVKSSSCQFVKTNVNRGSFSRPDVIIKADDGKRFAAHASILSEKSEKLAAAVRFHLMSKQESDILEIHLDASSELCLFFLQHIYHGSMLKLEVLNKDPVRIVHSILDLLILADEYIVPSLTQECVMRLLSKDICQCFCRSCTKTVYDQSLSYYQACGPTVCLTTDTCLDILAVTQHIRQGDLPCTSSLSVLWEEPTLWGPADKHEMSVDPLDALSEAVHRYILLHYGELLESDSFKEHCCDSQLKEVSSRERAQEFLLLCLGQCAISPIGVYEIRSVSLTAVAAGDPLVEQLLPTRVCNGSSRQEPEPSRSRAGTNLISI